MLEISNIKLDPLKIAGDFSNENEVAKGALCKLCNLDRNALKSVEVVKSSIDARKKDRVVFNVSVRFELKDAHAEEALLKRLEKKRVAIRRPNIKAAGFSTPGTITDTTSPVVIGAGCAGLFCALSLAHAGLNPILIERGPDVFERQRKIDDFYETGELDLDANIQFGMGGAGTFSDGKLNTGTKSPNHRTILETFVKHGASPRILIEAKPHIGSDVLPFVVQGMCNEIESLGGTILYRTTFNELGLQSGKVTSIGYSQIQDDGSIKEGTIHCSDVVLSCGHSARDVFELLHELNFTLERKTFAMGVRIEHPQKLVNESQYGKIFAQTPSLAAAPYKLVHHLGNDRSAFSFCMCPGGYVVAATNEEEHVVTNGMSLSDRAGSNANSGLLSNVYPEDLPGTHPLAGVYLQEEVEKKAFELGGGDFKAPATLVADFLKKQSSSGQGTVTPTYSRGVTWGDVSLALPDYIHNTLRESIPSMARKLKGFDMPDAVLTGVESRSSSPVRIVRDKSCESVDYKGVWPCGEGAGYAGGIMSAASDGMRIAYALMTKRSENK